MAKLSLKVPRAPPKRVIVFVATWAGRQCYVRIAYTDRAYLRLGDLSYAIPFAKALLYTLESVDEKNPVTKDTESWLHTAFAEERYWGSWFVASSNLVGFIEHLRAGTDANRPIDVRLAHYQNTSTTQARGSRTETDLARSEALIRAVRAATEVQNA